MRPNDIGTHLRRQPIRLYTSEGSAHEVGQPEMTLVAMIGPQGYLELALVGDDAHRFLGIQPGAEVAVEW